MRTFPTLLLAGALLLHALPSPADPMSMFEGASQGRGDLTLGLGHAKPYTVDNLGRRDADGTLRLHQVVHMAGEPDRSRDWVIHPAGNGTYTFTLSDASGPGVATVEGARLSLRYAPHPGMRMRQVLELSPDGTTLSNTGRISLLGSPIGHLDEMIVRTGVAAKR
ncbi:hypothetical protein [Cognatilysobacter segetis]|uniref:hypothetical protein n=1 Tax=Cognatilysobacter segetis TaxID=2492394 RepID=UPI00105F3E22|nr:hypothetical protein [Lysobacter segetis]